jgi:hypothetical protein
MNSQSLKSKTANYGFFEASGHVTLCVMSSGNVYGTGDDVSDERKVQYEARRCHKRELQQLLIHHVYYKGVIWQCYLIPVVCTCSSNSCCCELKIYT